MLKRVTFTGIDNKTDINKLVKLKSLFPFVEFGILISSNNTNMGKNNRYPDLSVIEQLKDKDLNLACHICGRIARDIVYNNDWSGVHTLLGEYFNIFERFQLNVSMLHKFSEEIEFPEGKTFIIQLKDDSSLYDFYKDRVSNVQGFQDNSGGTGSFLDSWMDADRYFGYAGGLSADNVQAVLETFKSRFSHDYWIDMESSVRTDDWFDIDKCRKVLEICQDYIQ